MKGAVLFAIVLASMMASAHSRKTLSLSGPGWLCDGEEVCIPHTWNSLDGADGSPAGEPPPASGMSIAADS